MRVPRILVQMCLEKGCRVTVPPGAARHLIRVLRLRAGDSLALFNGDGRDYSGRLLNQDQSMLQVQIDAATDMEPRPVLDIHLGVGVSKGDRMDMVVQKAVELGVTRISPLFTERSLVRLDRDRLQKRHQHWKGILVSACEQSGRRRVPELCPGASLSDWVSQRHSNPLLLDHRGERALPTLAALAESVTILCGPEGGLTPDERSQARCAGFTPVRLGPRILRAETAPLAAMAAIQALWGDFRG